MGGGAGEPLDDLPEVILADVVHRGLRLLRRQRRRLVVDVVKGASFGGGFGDLVGEFVQVFQIIVADVCGGGGGDCGGAATGGGVTGRVTAFVHLSRISFSLLSHSLDLSDQINHLKANENKKRLTPSTSLSFRDG